MEMINSSMGILMISFLVILISTIIIALINPRSIKVMINTMIILLFVATIWALVWLTLIYIIVIK